MLDITYIRENLELVKKSAAAKKIKVDLDELLKLDDQRRKLTTQADILRAKRNSAAKQKDIEGGKKVKGELDVIEKQLFLVNGKWEDLMWQVPNIILPDVPVGDATKNKVIRKSGNPPKFNFTPKDHIELGKLLDIIDIDRGVKVAGFRGYFLKGKGALLQLAIIHFVFDYLVQKGYEPVIPPVINKRMAFEGTGWFPEKEEETYKIDGEEMYLAGTSEVPVTALHADEILKLSELPKRYVAYSPCFRTEVGSYGRDTKGLYRLHEFVKVEQVVLCEADEKQSLGFFEEIEGNAESLLEQLGLPYQVVVLASEEMGKKPALSYDIETWMPSRENYGETHSNSLILDFQSRRLKIRYRDRDNQLKYVHTLNNTAIASPRILIAMLENFQQEDGTVKIPEVLQKYTGFSEITAKK